MLLKHLALAAVVAAATTTGGNVAFASHIIAPPVTLTGPEFNSDFALSHLFEATVTDADLNTVSYTADDDQWAGPGVGPHEVLMDFGTSISTTDIAYSQRTGTDPVADKIGTIDFWFSDSDFGSFPADPPDTTATITNTTDTVLTTYGLGGSFSGQYVAARFNAASTDPPINNPGGSEMRFLAVPEPGGLLLASLASVISGLLSIRRRDGR